MRRASTTTSGERHTDLTADRLGRGSRSTRQPHRTPILVVGLLIAVAACTADRTGDGAGGQPDDTGTAPARMAAGAPAEHVAESLVVYKSPTCECCQRWVEHMRSNGFRVVVHDVADVAPVKRQHGIGDELGSCHTALVGGYVLEGHVPAADVKRLLRERPSIAGLAVPGMPAGSPGMEVGRVDRYDVLALQRDGAPTVFARH